MGWTWDGETIPMKQVGRMIGLGLLLLAGLVIMLNDRTEPVVGAARAEQTAADGQLALGQAALTVTKVASPAIAGVGQMITYTYVVENLSTALITDVQALDDPLGVVPLGVTELAAGEVVTGVRTYTVSEDDLPGPLTNTVAVSGVVDGETPVQASAIATVTLISSPALAIAKSVSPAVAAPGVTLTYSYHLTNTGDVTLDSLIAEDDRLGAAGARRHHAFPRPGNHPCSGLSGQPGRHARPAGQHRCRLGDTARGPARERQRKRHGDARRPGIDRGQACRPTAGRSR